MISMNSRKSRSRPVSVSAGFAIRARISHMSAEDLEPSTRVAIPVSRHPAGHPLRVHPSRSMIGILSWFVHLSQVEDKVLYRGRPIGTAWQRGGTCELPSVANIAS